MASNRDWAQAYLEQAKEDLKAAKMIRRLEAPSDFCMLMQMTFEKVAKAALLRKGQINLSKAQTTHVAASKLIKPLKTHREFLTLTDTGKPYLWKDVSPLVTQLERAQPSVAKSDASNKRMAIEYQLEYPWESESGEICWPARHFPLNAQFQSSETTAPRLAKFASVLISDVERCF